MHTHICMHHVRSGYVQIPVFIHFIYVSCKVFIYVIRSQFYRCTNYAKTMAYKKS